MSSMTQYSVEVKGPESDRLHFAGLIEAAVWGASSDGDIAIPFASIFPDWNDTEQYRAFWITPSDRQLFQSDSNRLTFSGESRNTPPIRFFLRVSEKFPALSFEIRSVTEHTLVETWFVKDGRAKLIEAFVDPIREPCEWFVKDGVALGPLPDWIEQHYPLNG